jgi:hypothetical protein
MIFEVSKSILEIISHQSQSAKLCPSRCVELHIAILIQLANCISQALPKDTAYTFVLDVRAWPENDIKPLST